MFSFSSSVIVYPKDVDKEEYGRGYHSINFWATDKNRATAFCSVRINVIGKFVLCGKNIEIDIMCKSIFIAKRKLNRFMNVWYS